LERVVGLVFEWWRALACAFLVEELEPFANGFATCLCLALSGSNT
jgi:hypothetical protein